MMSDVTKKGSKFLVNGVEFRLRGFRLISNRNILGIHKLTFTIELERDTNAERKKKEAEKDKLG